MRLGIVGLPGAGKSTAFEALTRTPIEPAKKAEPNIGTVSVPDPRVDALSGMYRPKKTTRAQVQYFLPGRGGDKEPGAEETVWTSVRTCDALIAVIRNFGGAGFPPTPEADFLKLSQEMMFADLLVVEKRISRLELDQERGKKFNEQELALLLECNEVLTKDVPLRRRPDLATHPLLKGFMFISAKPLLVLFNNADEDDLAPRPEAWKDDACTVVRGKLEAELARMTPEETAGFLADFGIAASALDRVVRRSYDVLGLISFFTVGEDEVRAWTIRRGTSAVDAADVIHSDIRKGFVRAEVLGYDELQACGSYQEAKRKGLLRLEGKTYVVADGDIIDFRFNV
jgi:hypothetical protein